MSGDVEDVIFGILAAAALVAIVASGIWIVISAPLQSICFFMAIGFCFWVSDKLKNDD